MRTLPKISKSTKYSADLECTTKIDDCRVWAWGLCEVGDIENFTYGDDLDEFIDFCKRSSNSTFYFHNLRYDGVFLLLWLYEHGYTHILDRKEKTDKTFTTLISGQGAWYSITIYFEVKGKRVNKVTINDSMKILPFSVEDVAKAFKLPIKKGKIDYKAHDDNLFPITDEELEYLKNDVQIVAMALETLFSQNLDAMTQGSNALMDYKNTVGKKSFDKWFPTPDYDSDVRQAYKGGFTYVNPMFKALDLEIGIVFDVNSLYPSVMYYDLLPYGEGMFFKGKYEEDDLYKLYVQTFTCQFELKENKIPTIQLKNNLAFIPTDYLHSSGDEEITLTLTNIDLDLFFEHYEVYNISYDSGWKFKGTVGLFKDYIGKWSSIKIQSKIDKNYGMYTLAKLMLNALYGKFAVNPRGYSKIPFYDNGVLKYRKGEDEDRKPLYIPMGAFITSYARNKTIRSAQKVYHRFAYADTDSLHLVGAEIPSELEIDETLLGAWKHESTFARARFLRQKTYYECNIVSDEDYEYLKEEEKEKCYIYKGHRLLDKITCSGLPKGCYPYVTWDNFKEKAVYKGKLTPKHVKGGIVLVDSEFTIKSFSDKKVKRVLHT